MTRLANVGKEDSIKFKQASAGPMGSLFII